jgi:hypothetical protein
VDPGDSDFLPGEILDIITFEAVNKGLKSENKKPLKGERLLLGLTRIALYTDSWLSAASFQETIRVLVEASTTKRLDSLEGLKENVIIGKLIPAGAVYRRRHMDRVRWMEDKVQEEITKGIRLKQKDEAEIRKDTEEFSKSSDVYPVV